MSETGMPRKNLVHVIVAWVVVLIPLAWGVYETGKRAMSLFTE
jgi:hypothetical protein